MRSGRTAATTAVVLALAVFLMHLGMPVAMAAPAQHGAAMAHHAAPRDTVRPAPSMEPADHHPSVQKQTVDAVHQHEAHDCAGTVVVHKGMGAPALVAVLPRLDGAIDTSPAHRAAVARGPPPWTVLDLARLCVLRL